jgi:nitrate reductase NapE
MFEKLMLKTTGDPTSRQFNGAATRVLQGVGSMSDEGNTPVTPAQELRTFLLLSVVLAPVLAVGIVAGYGFLVWMYQLFAGPPGSHF